MFRPVVVLLRFSCDWFKQVDQIDWVNDAEVVITSIASAAAVAALFFYWRRLRKGLHLARDEELKVLITEVTKQIQPGANGGLSLTDLHLKFDQMYERQTQIIDDVLDLKRDLTTLKEAVVIIENDLEGIE